MDLEALLRRLEGVVAARVRYQDGEPEAIHLLVEGDPGESVQQVQALLMTALGKAMPPGSITTSPAGDRKWQRQRWQLVQVYWLWEKGQHEVVVQVRDGGRIYEGKMPVTSTGKGWSVADATVQAVKAVLGRAFARLHLAHLEEIRVAGVPAVLVAVRTGLIQPQILFGIAEGDVGSGETVARSTLDALNRLDG
ncbi:MAG: hypothetical protein QJR00_05845 [Bacillota bacterium]|nr:hypothetical protein [Bacillota bacterium]